MSHQVHIFQLPRDARPTERPVPVGSFAVIADTHDAARAAALDRLAADGLTVRSLSFLVDGGVAVVVTDPPPSPTPAQVRRARKGE